MRASLPVDLPWIQSLLIIGEGWHGSNVRRQSALVGINLSDRSYFKKAQQTRDFVFSDFLVAKTDHKPIMIAAYPASAIDDAADFVVAAGVDLDWVSTFMGNLASRPGIFGGSGRQRRCRTGGA